MAFIIGFVLGDALNRIGFFRALAVWLVICGTSFLGHELVSKNVDRSLATPAAIAVPTALFVWALWNPAAHRFRMWIVDGSYLAARIGMWVALAFLALILMQVGFRLRLWVDRAWTWAVLAAVLWMVQRAMLAWVARSHRIAVRHRTEITA